MGIVPFWNFTNIATFPKSGITVKFGSVDIPPSHLKCCFFSVSEIHRAMAGLSAMAHVVSGNKFKFKEENI
jgi:hypothetical protein